MLLRRAATSGSLLNKKVIPAATMGAANIHGHGLSLMARQLAGNENRQPSPPRSLRRERSKSDCCYVIFTFVSQVSSKDISLCPTFYASEAATSPGKFIF